MANVNPIFVDGQIAGVVSVVKNITEIQTLMERLTQVSAKAEYLEQELLRTKKMGSSFTNYIGKSGRVVDIACAGIQGSGQQRDRADPWGKRHGQGAYCRGHPLCFQTAERSVHPRELWCNPFDIAGIRAFWT